MVTVTEIRCPGKKRHSKRKGDYIVTEECCNALLGFIDTSVEDSKVYYKCKDCKSVLRATVKDEFAFIKLYDSTTKIKSNTGKVVLE